jgi:hypothetical protein
MSDNRRGRRTGEGPWSGFRTFCPVPFYLDEFFGPKPVHGPADPWRPQPLDEALGRGDLTVAGYVARFITDVLGDALRKGPNYFFDWLGFAILWEQFDESPCRRCLSAVQPALAAVNGRAVKLGAVTGASTTQAVVGLADELSLLAELLPVEEAVGLARTIVGRDPPESDDPVAWVRRYETAIGFNLDHIAKLRRLVKRPVHDHLRRLAADLTAGVEQQALEAEVEQEYSRAGVLRMSLGIPMSGMPASAGKEAGNDDRALPPLWRKVLALLPAGQRLPGKKILAGLGRRYKPPYLRGVLSKMCKAGLLVNDRDGFGYARGPEAPPGR